MFKESIFIKEENHVQRKHFHKRKHLKIIHGKKDFKNKI
jgi:hypothetical protein